MSDEKTVLSLSLRPEQKLIWVTGVLGKGLDWFFELQRIGLANGYEWAGFRVEPNMPWGKSIAKFCKAELMASDEKGNEYCVSLRAR